MLRSEKVNSVNMINDNLGMSRSAIERTVQYERMLNEYVAITGRSFNSAKRFLARLNGLASVHRFRSIDWYWSEWRTRTLKGWAYHRFKDGLHLSGGLDPKEAQAFAHAMKRIGSVGISLPNK